MNRVVTVLSPRRLRMMAFALVAAATARAGEYTAYFDSVSTTTTGAAKDSIGPTISIGVIFVVVAIVIGLIMRARRMGSK